MTLDDAISEPSGITVEVVNPETPFGGVQVFGVTERPIQIEFSTGSPVLSVFGRIGDVVPLCSDYDQCYAPIEAGVPPGGSEGQVLKKVGDATFDTFWADASSLPDGGTTGQVLAKLSNTDFDADWITLPPGVDTFLELTDAPDSYTGEAGNIVAVNGAENALEFIPLPAGVSPDDPTALVGLVAVNGAAPTFMRSDGAPALDQSIDPTWSGNHTFENNIVIPLLPIDADHAASKAYADSLFVPSGTRLLSGGDVAYTGTGLNFIISAATYLINGVQYSSPQTPVTLAAADPTNDRIDVFYVDTSGLAGVITGTPGGPPLEPQVDPVTQLRLTSAVVPAASGVPLITLENVYLENTEWTMSASAGSINVASTSNPYAGTKDIEGTSVATGAFFTAVRPGGPESLATATLVQLQLRSKALWPNPKALSVFFMNGASNVGTPVTIKQGYSGFDSGITTGYQQITMPISSFNLGASSIDRLRIAVTGGGGNIGWYIDNIIIQTGSGGAPPGGDFSTNTNVSVVGEPVLFANTTGKLGKRATGTGIADLTSGVLGVITLGTGLTLPAHVLTLDSDLEFLATATPTANQFYGTDDSSVRGFYDVDAKTLYSQLWTWTTKTTDANTSGQIGLNTAAWNTATVLNINERTTDNRDMTPAFNILFVTGNQVYIQMKTDATRFARYLITGAGTDHGTWWSFPISHQDSGGAILAGNTPTVATILVAGGATTSNAFGTVAVSGQSDIVADAAADTLNIAAGSGISLTTNASTDTLTIAAAPQKFIVGATFERGGAALTTGKGKGYVTCPVAGTITAWSIGADAGTATIKVWKKATGTAVPTVADLINTTGVQLSTGTYVRSTTLSDFTTTTVAAGDIFAFDLSAVSGVAELTFQLEITPAANAIRTVGTTVDGGGSAITTGKTKGYFTAPITGTITGWAIAADAGTVTFKVWKKATGTAVPTVADNINTSGVSLSTGTYVHSNTTSDFTSTAVTAGDIIAFNLTSVSAATELTLQLEITPS